MLTRPAILVPGPVGNVTLRPVLDEDFAFLWWLHQATMREYVEKTWGWDDALQAQRFRDAFVADREGMAIVERAAERIGYLRVVRYRPRWFLAAIVIAPTHQRQGIGGRLVASVCQDADALGVPVDLQVLKVNPAIRLYQRLGFVLTGETGTHFTLRHEPPRAA